MMPLEPEAKIRVLFTLSYLYLPHSRAGTETNTDQLCKELQRQGHDVAVLDCLSLVARPGSQWSRPNIVVRNPNFMGEVFSAGKMADVFASLPRSATPMPASAPRRRSAPTA